MRSLLIVAGAAVLVVACSSASPAASPRSPSPSAPSTLGPDASGAPSVQVRPTPAASVPANASARPTFAAVPAGDFESALVEGLTTDVDVPFTHVVECGARDCILPIDVLAPTEGDALPTIVLVGGGDAFDSRRYLELLAAGLARRGAVVLLAAHRTSATGNQRNDTVDDVRCAIRYARFVTEDYGGDAERVVVVGHSVGSELALEVATTPETDTPGCLADGDAVPEAVVGLAGFRLTVNGITPSGPPTLLASGAFDGAAAQGAPTAEQLREAGFHAEYREFPATLHHEIVDPEITPGVVDLVFEAADWTAQPPN